MDTAWIIDTFFTLFSFILAIFIFPGLLIFQSGVTNKNNILLNTTIFLISCLVFFLWGYKLAFGKLNGESMSAYAAFLLQMAFAAKNTAILNWKFEEKFSVFIIFAIFMSGFIYPLIVNWSWGWDMLRGTAFDISQMHDLAGSAVVYSTGGWAFLAILLITKRSKKEAKESFTKNIPLTILGGFLIWISWFGFNGASVGSISDKISANTVAFVIMNTNNAAIMGGIAVVLLKYFYKKIDISMVLNGALGGLVAISSGADVINPYETLLIGLIAGVLFFFSDSFLKKINLDYTGTLAIYLINGIWGIIATGIFASNTSLTAQIKGEFIIGIFSFFSSYIIFYLIYKFLSKNRKFIF